MQVSTKARYAIMALIDVLKIQHDNDNNKPVNLDTISQRQNISLSYLEQLFMALRKAQIVKSMRGPGGGYTLNKNPVDVSLYSIIIAVNEPLKFSRCNGLGWIKGKGCMKNGNTCNTHELWASLSMHIDDFLKNVTLQNILDENCHKFLSNDMQAVIEEKMANGLSG